MLWKCCTQYASEFGKFSNDHQTGKGQFSFQSQRKAIKEFQTTVQPHAFHRLTRLCSKFFKLGLSRTWTKNFQIHKLGLKKAEESETKLPNIRWTMEKAREFQKNTSTSASLTMLKPLTVWITTNCRVFFKRREWQTTLPVSWETCMQVKKQQLEPYMEQLTGSKLGK